MKKLIVLIASLLLVTDIFGMTDQAITQPIPDVKTEAEKDSCRICLTEFEPAEKADKLKCSHIFHDSCINAWYEKSGNLTCPLCRATNTEIIEAFISAIHANDGEKVVNILKKNRSLANYMVEPKERTTILHYAAARGRRRIVNVLLMFRASPYAKNLQGELPIHLAAAQGHYPTVYRLCTYKGTINARDQEGHTPLHRAAIGGWVKTVRTLIEKGAIKDRQTYFTKYTPLHCAVIHQWYQTAEELLQQNVDPSIEDWKNRTALNHAVLSGKTGMTNLLLRYRFAGA